MNLRKLSLMRPEHYWHDATQEIRLHPSTYSFIHLFNTKPCKSDSGKLLTLSIVSGRGLDPRCPLDHRCAAVKVLSLLTRVFGDSQLPDFVCVLVCAGNQNIIQWNWTNIYQSEFLSLLRPRRQISGTHQKHLDNWFGSCQSFPRKKNTGGRIVIPKNVAKSSHVVALKRKKITQLLLQCAM